MSITKRQKVLLVLGFIGAIGVSGHVRAADGLYLGMDLGMAIAPGLSTIGSDNDVGTKCDGFLNPDRVEVTNECDVQPPPSAWKDDFSGGIGILSGLTLGYRFGNFRGEGEYFYRATTHNDRSNDVRIGDDVTLGKLDQELDLVDENIDDVMSHNAFANLYYDIPTTSRFTPYVGIGVGIAHMAFDYFGRFRRNVNPAVITTFNDPTMRNRIAGTTTVAQAKLTDTLLGYQALAGVDYLVSEQVTLGVKVRWADFGEFSARREWDQLRSHDSAIGPGGQRVRYEVMTDDMQFFGASLNLKYHF